MNKDSFPMFIKDLSTMSIDDLLEEYISAAEYAHDMNIRSDYVHWSPEAEKDAYRRFYDIECEIKRRCGEDV